MRVMEEWRLNRETVARNLAYLGSCQLWQEAELHLVGETVDLLVRQLALSPLVVATVSRDLCKQYCLVPIDKIGRSLTLAMVNPLNVQALEDVEKATGCSVQAFVSTATDINSAINRYYETR